MKVQTIWYGLTSNHQRDILLARDGTLTSNLSQTQEEIQQYGNSKGASERAVRANY